MVEKKIVKVGTSLGIIINRDLLNKISAKEGSEVFVQEHRGYLTIRSNKHKRLVGRPRSPFCKYELRHKIKRAPRRRINKMDFSRRNPKILRMA